MSNNIVKNSILNLSLNVTHKKVDLLYMHDIVWNTVIYTNVRYGKAWVEAIEPDSAAVQRELVNTVVMYSKTNDMYASSVTLRMYYYALTFTHAARVFFSKALW